MAFGFPIRCGKADSTARENGYRLQIWIFEKRKSIELYLWNENKRAEHVNEIGRWATSVSRLKYSGHLINGLEWRYQTTTQTPTNCYRWIHSRICGIS